MRIIAGEFGGRKLLPPPSERTRPITDRAKQSLFDALGDRVEGALVLDAFAGTGSIGLECLSRGARGASCGNSSGCCGGASKGSKALRQRLLRAIAPQ